jgi:hypothetical protein
MEEDRRAVVTVETVTHGLGKRGRGLSRSGGWSHEDDGSVVTGCLSFHAFFPTLGGYSSMAKIRKKGGVYYP